VRRFLAFSTVVLAIAAILLVVGLITWLTGKSGIDNPKQIITGATLTLFSATWLLVGWLMRMVENLAARIGPAQR
jgi:hypothetical protein